VKSLSSVDPSLRRTMVLPDTAIQDARQWRRRQEEFR
jgi:hypothetical protein